MNKHNKLVNDAVKMLHKMPANVQTNVALAILDYAANEEVPPISDH